MPIVKRRDQWTADRSKLAPLNLMFKRRDRSIAIRTSCADGSVDELRCHLKLI
jgi:hypothetical protein